MFDERFARQYRYELPSEFPLTSPFSGIVHHLSGPNGYAQTQTSLDEEVGCWCKIPASLSLRKQVYPPVNSHIR